MAAGGLESAALHVQRGQPSRPDQSSPATAFLSDLKEASAVHRRFRHRCYSWAMLGCAALAGLAMVCQHVVGHSPVALLAMAITAACGAVPVSGAFRHVHQAQFQRRLDAMPPAEQRQAVGQLERLRDTEDMDLWEFAFALRRGRSAMREPTASDPPAGTGAELEAEPQRWAGLRSGRATRSPAGNRALASGYGALIWRVNGFELNAVVSGEGLSVVVLALPDRVRDPLPKCRAGLTVRPGSSGPVATRAADVAEVQQRTAAAVQRGNLARSYYHQSSQVYCSTGVARDALPHLMIHHSACLGTAHFAPGDRSDVGIWTRNAAMQESDRSPVESSRTASGPACLAPPGGHLSLDE